MRKQQIAKVTNTPFTGVALILAALLSPLAAPAQQASGLTPSQVASLRTVSSAAISPDGARIAYTLSVPRRPQEEPNGSAWAELYVSDLDGNSWPFVTGQVNVSSVAWVADLPQISFLAKREGDKFRSLYVIPTSGGEARRVVAHGANITGYTWSGDGCCVAFLANEPEPKTAEKLRKQGFNQKIYEEDDRWVRVWVVNRFDPDAVPHKLDLEGNASELHWSPTDNRLVVALAPTPFIDDHYMKRRLSIVDSSSGQTLARIENPGKLGHVEWSPDGKHIALISAADPNDPLEGRLMVVASGGGALRDLIPGYEGHVDTMAWSSNNSLVYIAEEGVWTASGEVRIDGTKVSHERLADGPVLGSLSYSLATGGAAYVGLTSTHPPELFAETKDGALQRLTDSNPWLSGVALGSQERVQYKARDGLTLEGILIRPVGEKPGKRYPLIVVVHGGPEGRFANAWVTSYSRPGQMAAARGFAVFYPNYRASTGRGVEFSKMNHEDPAGKEFDDIIDGVDHLIATGLVDKNRVGITGGSYGGFATGWASTYYSDRFAAGVMFVGISNQISKWGVTDIPNEVFQVHQRMKMYENWMFFLKRSPIYYADRSQTPLLILHGTEDKRVPTFQSIEMYRHLKERGQAPVRLVLYPGEAHGNRKAAARFDYNLRMLRWFEHYLKGPGGEMPDYEVDYDGATGK